MTKEYVRYSLILIGSATLILIGVSTINLVVDPFAMYRIVELEGLNTLKPAIYNRVRLLKAYQVRNQRPESIVLGTSRVHLGISPQHAGWAARYRNRYNLAFDGATTKEMYHYLKHANASGRLRHVILGLDSYHLSGAPASTRPDFDVSLLSNENHWLNFPRLLAADLRILTSLSTLREALNTVKAQTDPQPVWLANNGQRLGEVFFRRPDEKFTRCGPRCYFDEIDKLEVRYKLEWRIPPKPGRPVPASIPQEIDPLTSFDYVEKIIAYCQSRQILLDIFLTPSHAHQLELDTLTGSWWSVENGKRQLVQLQTQYTTNSPRSTPVQIVDFNGYNEITMEPLSPKNSKAEMRYYWDSSHFKENVGNLVLDRILDSNSHRLAEFQIDFGVRLDAGNIDTVIENLRKGQIEYRTRHAAEVTQLETWVSEFKQEHNIE